LEGEAEKLAVPTNSNLDMLIQSQISRTENNGNKDLQSVKRGQTHK
jgi:hypothetical protein